MKATTLHICLFVILWKIIASYGDGIIVLDQNNFEQVLSQVKFVLVEFYLPGCTSCHRFAHEYSKAAQEMSPYSPKIKFFEVDASTEKTLVKQYEIKTFPTTKLFIQGSNYPLEYNGEHKAHKIIEWVKNKCFEVTTKILRIEEVDKIVKDGKIVGIFFGNPKSKEHETFLDVARQIEGINFLETNEKDLKTAFGIEEEPTFILLKNFDEERKIFRETFNTRNLKKFITQEKYPAVVNFTAETWKRIFLEEKDAVFLFVNLDDSQRTKEVKEIVKYFANKLKDKFIFTIVDFDEEIGIPIAKYTSIPLNEFLEVERGKVPVVRIFQPKNKMRRYLCNREINVENLKMCFIDFENERLTPLYMSGPIPKNPYEGDVQIAVQNNYKEIVLNSDKNVLVLLCNSHHYICQSFGPLFSNIATKLKGEENLVLVKVDTSLNEIAGVKSQSTLDLLLYLKGKKNVPIFYQNQLDESSIIAFIEGYLNN